MEFREGETILAKDNDGKLFAGKYQARCGCGALLVKDKKGYTRHVKAKDVVFPWCGTTITHDPAIDYSRVKLPVMFRFTYRFGLTPTWTQAPKKSPPEPMYLVYLGDGDALDHDPDDENETPFLTEDQAIACAKKQANATGKAVGVFAKVYEVHPGESKVVKVIHFKA